MSKRIKLINEPTRPTKRPTVTITDETFNNPVDWTETYTNFLKKITS